MAEPQTPPTGSSLEDIQDEILDRLHAGEPVERAEAIARHPEHAEALGRFFQILDVLEVPPDVASDRPVRLGEYEIGPEIGRGGMGVVYRAMQMPLNRPVALKILPPALRQDRRLLKRFQRESAAAGRLRHPNIVPVYSVGEAGGAPFFAMELVQGCSLADLLRMWKAERGVETSAGVSGVASASANAGDRAARHQASVAHDQASAASEHAGAAGVQESDPAASHTPTFPDHLPSTDAERIPWAVSLMARVLDALDYAHAEGIVHRDVKPGNILTEADGTPRLTDFGLALDLAATELTVTGEVFGSPLYMSPEQAFRREAPLDARTDIYSVAVTLYELLSLRLPYSGTSRNALVSALGDGQLVPLREVAPDAPRALEAVLHKAMAHEPDDRFRRASDFAAALRDSLEHPDDLPPGVPRLAPAVAGARDGGGTRRPWWRRHPIAAGILLLLGLFITTVVTVSLAFLFSSYTPELDELIAGEPTLEQLDALANGTMPVSEQLLANWFQPTVHVRSVVARDTPGICEVRYGIAAPAMPPDFWIGVRVRVEVDGEERGSESFMFTYAEQDGGGPLHLAGSMPLALEDLLAGHLDQDLVTIRVRATLRIQRRTGASQSARFVGTQREHVFDEKALILYDHYPADYPLPVSDPETDAAMRLAYTPLNVHPNGWRSGGDAEPMLIVNYAAYPDGPASGCFDLELLDAQGEHPVAIAGNPFAPSWIGSTVTGFLLRFTPVAGLDQAGLEYLDDVKSGRTDSVRLRFRSSRAAALKQPDVERYWVGSFVAEVPVDLSP